MEEVFPEKGVLPPAVTVYHGLQWAALRITFSYAWKPEVFPEKGVLPPAVTVYHGLQWVALRIIFSYAWKPELRKDLEEVKELLAKASRPRVCKVLQTEQCKLEKELADRIHQQEVVSEPKKPAAIVGHNTTTYTAKINNYGWDQSNTFVKIYVTLSGVHKVPADNVQVCFAERSFELLVKDLNGKNYSLIINNLLKPISVEGSSRKIKTDTVLVMCRKKADQHWECITQVEKQLKEKNKPSLDKDFDKDADPNEGLMKLMKKMYDEGDDEMKRTLNKAWMESREKQERGQMDF